MPQYTMLIHQLEEVWEDPPETVMSLLCTLTAALFDFATPDSNSV
jgi:hypothetical protein